jgi:hypothetical protein
MYSKTVIGFLEIPYSRFTEDKMIFKTALFTKNFFYPIPFTFLHFYHGHCKCAILKTTFAQRQHLEI